jgi:serine phosphatase RsbU (regulator of sigma subunit)
MPVQSTTDVIQTVFDGLAPADLAALRAVATTRAYPPDAVLCHEGASEHIFYIVAEGAAVVYQTLADGAERVLDLRRRGEFFGEMALIDNMPRTASVRAVTHLTVIEVTEETFDQVLARSPAVALTIMRQVVGRLRRSDQMTIDELREKNEALAQAYRELQEAQPQLLERAALRRELEVAAEVQRGLLPREIPNFEGFAFAGYNLPARQVGGDLYDVLWLDNDHVGLLMADVSDKGVHAALYMAITKTLFQTHAKRSLSPAKVAHWVHQGLLEASATDEMFVTAFYGVLECRSREVVYVRAGQERALLVRGDGTGVYALPGDGRFLGQLEGLHLDEGRVQMEPGDLLVLYSDGVPDAADPAGERYGGERLRAVVAGLRGWRPQHALEALIADVRAHVGEAAPFDDMTLLLVAALTGDAQDAQDAQDAEGDPA